jgi:hypothetical protein
VIIFDYAEETRVAEFTVCGPLDETDVDRDLWFDPVRAQSRQAFGFGECWFGNFELVQLRAQIEQQFSVESSSDLSRENEIAVFVITNQQRAQADPLTLRICKTTDKKVLRQLALHLQPLL